MKNIKLLSEILKRTNKLIILDEYREAYCLGNSFSRKRKLSFSNAVYLICSVLRKSISSEIDNFIENYTYLNSPIISKQAFSKAIQNISPEEFKELCRPFVDSFYTSQKKLKSGINSTSLQLIKHLYNLLTHFNLANTLI